MVLGLCFILLLERGPGREHIAIQSYMLALVAALGALYALILAVQPVRDFFDLTRMGGGQLFLALLSAAAGLVLASVVWRIPAIEQLEDRPPPPGRGADRAGDRAAAPCRPRAPTRPRGDRDAIRPDGLPLTARPRIRAPHQDRRDRRAGEQLAGGAARALRRRASTSSGSTSPTGPRRSRPRTSAGSGRSSEEVGREVGILGDLPGPKLRLGDLEGDVAVLHSGSNVVLRGETNGTPGNAELLTVQWDGFAKAVHEGDPVFLADGRVRLRVLSVEGGEVTCEVEAGGAVSSHQGVNLPGADHDLPETGASDQPWIDFACENGIDLLAVSFVRRPSDLEKVEARLQGARRRHPADRQDREAAGGRARRGDHRGGGQRDHDRPRRPRRRAARSRRSRAPRSG